MRTVAGILIMLSWWIVLVVLTFGCQPVATLPKIVDVRYLSHDGKRMSLMCVSTTRAEFRPSAYVCDVDEVR